MEKRAFKQTISDSQLCFLFTIFYDDSPSPSSFPFFSPKKKKKDFRKKKKNEKTYTSPKITPAFTRGEGRKHP